MFHQNVSGEMDLGLSCFQTDPWPFLTDLFRTELLEGLNRCKEDSPLYQAAQEAIRRLGASRIKWFQRSQPEASEDPASFCKELIVSYRRRLQENVK